MALDGVVAVAGVLASGVPYLSEFWWLYVLPPVSVDLTVEENYDAAALEGDRQ